MSRVGLAFATVLVLVAAAAAIWKGGMTPPSLPLKGEEQKPVVRIGATLPLTGNLSYIGQSAKNSMEMAIEKWNADGNAKHHYELVVEDDGFEARKVALNAHRLLDADKVPAILSVFSIGANVISPITNPRQVIHMTCAYGSQPAEGFYNFNNITQYEPQTELMLQELKRRGFKSISLMISNNVGSVQQGEILEDKIKKDGSIEIVDKQVFQIGTKDFSPIVQKSLSRGTPDIFYVDGIAPEQNLLAKYLKQATGEIKLTTINDFIETPERGLFEGLWFVESASGTDAFIKEYEGRYGEPPFLCGSNSYDNVDMLIWAMENSDAADNQAVVEKLLAMGERDGATGRLSMTDGGIVDSAPAAKVIRNGKAVLAGE